MSLYEKVNRIIFIPTFRCQNRCRYCDYKWETIEQDKSYKLNAFGNEWTIDSELHWAYWLATLAPFRPYHLSLTGGEPTLYTGLVDLIEHLPRSCSWDITSNTMVEYAIDKITPANILTWTASYHYHHMDKFLANIKVLRQRGFPITVTLVLMPDNIEQVKEAITEFNKHFLRVNIHPVLKQGFNWNEHKDVLNQMDDIIKTIDSERLIKLIRDIRHEWQPDGAVESCPAGKEYFLVFPDGMVYRCYSHALARKCEPMAHISELKLNEKDEPCDGGCIFPCDIQCQRREHLVL